MDLLLYYYRDYLFYNKTSVQIIYFYGFSLKTLSMSKLFPVECKIYNLNKQNTSVDTFYFTILGFPWTMFDMPCR